MLDTIIQTGDINYDAARQAATPAVLAALEEGLAATGKPHQEAAKEFGLACGKYMIMCSYAKLQPLVEFGYCF